jgi:hypothetical protein
LVIALVVADEPDGLGRCSLPPGARVAVIGVVVPALIDQFAAGFL